MKRGQATLLIVLGIVIAAIAVTLLFYRTQVSEGLMKAGIIKQEALDIEADKASQKMTSCLESITADAVLQVASNGGYLETPNGETYYTKKDQLTAPTLKEVEQSVSSYVTQLAPFCFIGEQELNIEPRGDAKATTTIAKESVFVTVEYPMLVLLGQDSKAINDFTVKQKTGLGKLYGIAVDIAKTHQGKHGICLNCKVKSSLNEQVKINIYNPENDTDVSFLVTDKINPINGQPLVYAFAIKLGETQ